MDQADMPWMMGSNKDKSKIKKLKKSLKESSSTSAPNEMTRSKKLKKDKINLKIELFNMDTKDYHGIRTFLSSLSLSNLDISHLASFICMDLSEHVGTTVKPPSNISSSEDEYSNQIFAYSTMFHLAHYPSLLSFIKSNFSIDNFAKNEENYFLIIYQRFVNLPFTIGKPLFHQLITDFKLASKEDPQLFPLSMEKSIILILTNVYHHHNQDNTTKINNNSETNNKNDDNQLAYEYEELIELDEEYCLAKYDSKNKKSKKSLGGNDHNITTTQRLLVTNMNKLESYIK